MIGVGDTGSAILDLETYFAMLARQPQRHFATRRAMTQGIVDQVGDRLGDQFAVQRDVQWVQFDCRGKA